MAEREKEFYQSNVNLFMFQQLQFILQLVYMSFRSKQILEMGLCQRKSTANILGDNSTDAMDLNGKAMINCSEVFSKEPIHFNSTSLSTGPNLEHNNGIARLVAAEAGPTALNLNERSALEMEIGLEDSDMDICLADVDSEIIIDDYDLEINLNDTDSELLKLRDSDIEINFDSFDCDSLSEVINVEANSSKSNVDDNYSNNNMVHSNTEVINSEYSSSFSFAEKESQFVIDEKLPSEDTHRFIPNCTSDDSLPQINVCEEKSEGADAKVAEKESKCGINQKLPSVVTRRFITNHVQIIFCDENSEDEDNTDKVSQADEMKSCFDDCKELRDYLFESEKSVMKELDVFGDDTLAFRKDTEQQLASKEKKTEIDKDQKQVSVVSIGMMITNYMSDDTFAQILVCEDKSGVTDTAEIEDIENILEDPDLEISSDNSVSEINHIDPYDLEHDLDTSDSELLKLEDCDVEMNDDSSSGEDFNIETDPESSNSDTNDNNSNFSKVVPSSNEKLNSTTATSSISVTSICFHCNKIFTGYGILKSHIELNHIKDLERSYAISDKIKECDDYNKTPTSLKLHIGAKHAEEKSQKCSFCDYSTVCLNNLQ